MNLIWNELVNAINYAGKFTIYGHEDKNAYHKY